MKVSDTADVLTTIAGLHRSSVGKADVASWHPIIGHLDYDDALEAVRRHYTRSREWIMPADVIAEVKRIREERIDRANKTTPPPVDPDQAAAYRQALTAQIAHLANRRDIRHALAGPTPPARRRPTEPGDPDAPHRVAALAHPCPHCRAVPGRGCVIGGTQQPFRKGGHPSVHDSRLDVAYAAAAAGTPAPPDPDDQHAEAS